MAVVLKLSKELVVMAEAVAASAHRSVPQQIEYWARLGKAVDDNPDLPPQLVKDMLVGSQDVRDGLLTQYRFTK